MSVVVEDKPSSSVLGKTEAVTEYHVAGIIPGRTAEQKECMAFWYTARKDYGISKNIEAICRSEEEIKRRIIKVVRHEVAHFVGFTEEEIKEWGIKVLRTKDKSRKRRYTYMAETHSFDIVCKVEMHEVHNAVDQAKKQLAVRYDFKGSKSSITLNADDSITLIADDDYKWESH